jgi:hypothetical protein
MLSTSRKCLTGRLKITQTFYKDYNLHVDLRGTWSFVSVVIFQTQRQSPLLDIGECYEARQYSWSLGKTCAGVPFEVLSLMVLFRDRY